MAVAVLILNKYGIINHITLSEYSYLSNPQYDACLSTFEMNNNETDVIFVGDSITACGRFDEFFPDVELLNRGIGSDTVEGVFNRIDEVLSHKPKKIFFMIGINDISKGIPKESSMEYYKKTIRTIKDKTPDCDLYIESVLPTTTVDIESISSFNTDLRILCKNEDVVYIDIYSKCIHNDKIDTSLLSSDGVHLNGNGYQKLIMTINEYIE